MNVGAMAAGRSMRSVKRSRPPVWPSTSMSTVTPHTIMMTRHGMIFTASSSSPALSRLSSTAPANAPSPTSTSRKMTLTMSVAMTARVTRCVRENVTAPASSTASLPSLDGTSTAPSW